MPRKLCRPEPMTIWIARRIPCDQSARGDIFERRSRSEMFLKSDICNCISAIADGSGEREPRVGGRGCPRSFTSTTCTASSCYELRSFSRAADGLDTVQSQTRRASSGSSGFAGMPLFIRLAA
jgi:hypothetical protein